MSDVASAIRAATQRLASTSDTARLDAELLMAHALGVSRSDMLVRAMRKDVPASFDALVERRTAHEPIAYITGAQEFYGRVFAVQPGVLIPRSDSETLIAAALDACSSARRVLDLGTGSGALLITALLELPGAHGIATDASSDALHVARDNARKLGLVEAQADFRQRDWHEPGWSDDLGKFDLILCNPPYIEDNADLDPDVRDFEPAEALFAGKEGLDDYRVIIPQLGKLLDEDGGAIFEIGAAQANAVREIAQNCGFAAELRRDLAKRPRALVLTRPK